MIRIFDIASKDLLQLLRDRKIFIFLLIMPIAFTLLFGFASGTFSRGGTDPRLPVGFLDEDHSWLSHSLHDLLAASEVIRLQEDDFSTQTSLETLVAGEKLAATIIVPSGYEHKVLDGKPAKLTLIADSGATAGMSVESEALAAAIHLDSAVRTAMIMEQVRGDLAPFDYTYQQALSAWQRPSSAAEQLPARGAVGAGATGGAPAAGAYIIRECMVCHYGGAERFIQWGYKSRLYLLHQIVHRINPIP